MTVTFLTFLWKPAPGYRSAFSGRHVDILRRMVRRHYQKPHRFVLVTDDPTGVTEPDIELFELWPDFATLRNPSGRHNPSCYRRLRVFARDPGAWLGERVCMLDLDAVVVGDLAPLVDGPEDFRIWRSTTSGNPYNGSMVVFDVGARPRLWSEFDPEKSPAETKRARFYGSDQAWIAYCLGPHEATFGPEDGVYSWRNDIAGPGRILPARARIVFYHGHEDPWSPGAQKVDWVRENYR